MRDNKPLTFALELAIYYSRCSLREIFCSRSAVHCLIKVTEGGCVVLSLRLLAVPKRLRIELLLIVFLLMSGRHVPAQVIHKGPYVQGVMKDQATIHWVTVAGTVQFGTAPDKLNGGAHAYEHHKVILKSLKPNTTYYYNISEDGTEKGAGSFTTAPDDSDTPFTFIVYGDTRSRPDVHRKVVEAVMKENVQFILHTGDIVADGRNPEHWDIYFQTAGDLMRKVPIFFSLGNHERDADFYFDYFDLPGNERYYSFDWGNCHFIALDTNDPRFPRVKGYLGRQEQERRREMVEQYWDEQLTWLSRDLSINQKADFIIVFFHHPLRSTKSSRVDQRARLRGRFGRLFHDFGVDLIFNGHDHNYQHHNYRGVHYIVTGGGGAPFYDIEEQNADRYTVKLAQTEHYVRVKVNGEKLKVEAVKPDGALIESFELEAD